MASTTICRSASFAVLLSLVAAWPGRGEENARIGTNAEADLPVIADAPKTVDPATLMPASLTKQAIHREIENVIRRVEEGDGSVDPEMGGMGGFGGGFFSLSPHPPEKDQQAVLQD